MRANTITTKARTIIPGGILALGLAVVLLAATASTASAAFLSAIPIGSHSAKGTPPIDFGERQVGTTSPAQRVGLWLGPSEYLFNPRISVSGDYAQTNDCPPTLLRGQFPCLITVTFIPTRTGPRDGTLRTGPGKGLCFPVSGSGCPKVRLRGNGVKHRTPPALPLLLSVDVSGDLTRTLPKKVSFEAITNNDSKLVASGDVKKTTKRLAGSEKTEITAKLKHRKRLERRFVKRDRVGVRFKFAATDEFDQTDTDNTRAVFCRRVIPGSGTCSGR